MHSMRLTGRGRGSGSGLVLLLGVMVGCDPALPAGEALENYREPTVSPRGEWVLVESPDPKERLVMYEEAPSDDLQLLFMGGRAATPLRDGGAAWPDADGARVLVFDDHGIVARVAQGALPNGRNLTRPVSVAFDGESLLAVEADGQGLRFDADGPREWVSYGIEAPVFGGSIGYMVAARSVFEFHMAPVRPKDPLLWVLNRDTGKPTPFGSTTPPPDPFLGQLVNTGWTAATEDGGVIYASALRPELVAFEANGDTAWVSRWQPDEAVEPPWLDVVDGSVTPVFSVVQFGVVVGPDRLIYVLAASERGGPPVYVLAFDQTGRFVRSGAITQNDAVFADAGGRIYTTRREDALSRTGEPERAEFPDFALPILGQDNQIDLESHRGRVVVLNFWASWCGPCRREMPLLEAFAKELNAEQATVIGLNEDLDPDDALAFIEEIGGVSYDHGEGRGRLRSRYRYRGLPYTVVLDRDLRVIRSFYGFGSSIDPIRRTVELELTAGS